jgi:SET domain-containing protein
MEKFSIKKSHINGSGLFVNKPYKKGEFIEYIRGPVKLVHHFDSQLAKNSMNWIGISKFRWIDTQHSMFRYINHSCDPNVAIRGERTVYALKDIPANTEIAMDYSLTEADPDWHIKCNCKSQNCRKNIGPITSLPKPVFKKYEPILSKKFKLVYTAAHK